MLRRAFLAGAVRPPLALSLGGPFADAPPESTRIRNVRDYGAVADSATDDSPAIQRAIDDGGHGGTVFFPQGQYMIGAPLMLRNDTVLLAYGRHTVLTSATPGHAIIWGNQVKRVFLDGIYIHGNKSQRDGIVIENCDDVRLRACWVTMTGGRGIVVKSAPVVLIDSSIELNAADGVLVSDTNSGVPLHMVCCYVYQNGGDGVHFARNGNQAMVMACEIIENHVAGVHVEASAGVSVASNVILNNAGPGVHINGHSEFTALDGNFIVQNGGNGVLIEEGSDCTTLVGNRCVTNGRADPDRYAEIAVRGSRDVMMVANQLVDRHGRAVRAPQIDQDAASTVVAATNVLRPDPTS
jgi:hypothetical protein